MDEYFEKMKLQSDVTAGQLYAYANWESSRKMGCNAFVISVFPLTSDMQEFVNVLREADVRRILVADQSGHLLDALFALQEAGGTMNDLQTVEDNDGRQIKGIEFAI